MSRKGEFFMDKLIIGGIEIKNRLFVGSGKYPSNEIIKDVLEGSGSQVITLALKSTLFLLLFIFEILFY